MKLIKTLIIFTCFALVYLSSSLRRDQDQEEESEKRGCSSCRRRRKAKRLAAQKVALEARNARYDQKVFDSNTIDQCYQFTNGDWWGRKNAYFYCVNSYGETVRQKINMNTFIGNTNGNLVKGSGYWDSCDDTKISKKGVLSAKCDNVKGNDVATSVDIRKLLTWKNDKLSRK